MPDGNDAAIDGRYTGILHRCGQPSIGDVATLMLVNAASRQQRARQKTFHLQVDVGHDDNVHRMDKRTSVTSTAVARAAQRAHQVAR